MKEDIKEERNNEERKKRRNQECHTKRPAGQKQLRKIK